MAQLCQQYELHQAQITERKKQLLERTSDVFDTGGKSSGPGDLCPLHVKIGQQALEIDFLESALTKAGLLSAGK